MHKRSSSAGRERVSLEKVPAATANRSTLLSTSLSLLKNSPYSQPLERQKIPQSNTSNMSTSLPAVTNVRRSKTPPPKMRPLSSATQLPEAPTSTRRSVPLPPAPMQHSRPVTAHLPPTTSSAAFTSPNGMAKPTKSKIIPSKEKDRERERDRERDRDKEREGRDKENDAYMDFHLEEGRKGLAVIKPSEQLQLSEEQLSEEVQIVLTANDPQVRDGVVVFSLMDEAYKPSPSVDQFACVFDLEGYHLHVETEEGKKQLSINQEEKRKQIMHSSTFNSAAHLYGSGDYDDDSGPVLRNPFNFSDRAVQTISRPPRDRSTITEPAARGTFGATVTQWAIFDAYEEERMSAQGSANAVTVTAASATSINPSVASSPANVASLASNPSKTEPSKKIEEPRNFISVDSNAALQTRTMLQGDRGESFQSSQSSQSLQPLQSPLHVSQALLANLHVLERMVVLNASMAVALDFKYWDDPADQFQPEGTLLPLWKFSPSIALGKTVTALTWNPRYPDLFAIGHGSYDMVRMTAALQPQAPDFPQSPQSPEFESKLAFSAGVICCYSLKNVAHPEYQFVTESGVMCLDFHPQHPSLLAVGLYDGRVCVYSLTQPADKNPLFISSVRQKKHTEPVWMVHWQEDDLSKNLNFYSLSSDGRLTSWTLVKNEMLHNDILEMKITRKPSTISSATLANAPDPLPDDADFDTSLYGLAGGCSMDFLHGDHLFIVGTEEGALHKCSKAYSGRYLASYEGHNMAILSIEWNGFHPRVFLTCGADWSVKIWDHTKTEAIFALDFKIPVCDAKWAPYSSTIFAVATADGKISVYDLARNKRDPLCRQLVTKSVPSHIAFNPIQPILLVADSMGRVHSLKLSPNLRHLPIMDEGVALSKSKSLSMSSQGTGGTGSGSLLPSHSSATSAIFRVASSNKQSNLSPAINLSLTDDSDDPHFSSKQNDVIQEEICKLEQALMADFKKEKK